MKNIFYLVLLLLVSCTTNSPLTHSYQPMDVQQPLASQVEIGSQIKLVTKRNSELIFEVTQISDSAIFGNNVMVPISEIAHLEKMQVSVVKSGFWLAMIVGIINYLDNNLAFFPT